LAEIDELAAHLLALPADTIEMELSMSVMMTRDGEPIEVGTTLGRELAYTLSHTIHHNALIAAMVRTLGAWVPERFGYAPSTPQHQDRSACAH
jgi:uncharacterized damage-inducible protein DinB